MKSAYKQQQPRSKPMVDEELFNELKEAFNLFDSEQTGQIDARELKAAFKAFGFDIKKPDLVRLLKKDLNKDINENFSFQEFSNLLITRLGDLRQSKEYMLKVFKLFDEDGIGKISFKNLKKIASDIGFLLLFYDVFQRFFQKK